MPPSKRSARSTLSATTLALAAAAAAAGRGRSRLDDWEWDFGVNFMGVLHGIRAFIPRMLENGDEGHIVNTASMAGLLTAANPYDVSKHSVVCLTEGIYRDFKAAQDRLSASVLCPGWVNTNILESGRNRPPEYGERDTSRSSRRRSSKRSRALPSC